MITFDTEFDKKLEEYSKVFWKKFDSVMNEIDPKRALVKKNGEYIYTIAIPGFSKDEITVKNHKESKGITVNGSKIDSVTEAERKLNLSYTYPKGLSLKSVKCVDGLLYIFFEDLNKASTGEDVKID